MHKLALAFVFLLFNISINTANHSIGLIPSFLGYIFLFAGCRQFDRAADALAGLTVPALGMAIAEGIYYAALLLWGKPSSHAFFMVLEILSLTVALYFVYRIVDGIRQLESIWHMDAGFPLLKKAAVCLYVCMFLGFSLMCVAGNGAAAVVAWCVMFIGALRFCVAFFRADWAYRDHVKPELRHTL